MDTTGIFRFAVPGLVIRQFMEMGSFFMGRFEKQLDNSYVKVNSGAYCNLSQNSWHEIPATSRTFDPRANSRIAWTGTEMLIWGWFFRKWKRRRPFRNLSIRPQLQGVLVWWLSKQNFIIYS